MIYYLVAIVTESKTMLVAIGCRAELDLELEIHRFCQRQKLTLTAWCLERIIDGMMIVPSGLQEPLDRWWTIQEFLEADKLEQLPCMTCGKPVARKEANAKCS